MNTTRFGVMKKKNWGCDHHPQTPLPLPGISMITDSMDFFTPSIYHLTEETRKDMSVMAWYFVQLSWQSYDEMMKCGNTGMLKFWNTQMLKCWNANMLKGWDAEILKHWNAEMLKCYNAKMRKFRNAEMQKYFNIGMMQLWNGEMLNAKNAKMLKI